jgi:hypothetical protein
MRNTLIVGIAVLGFAAGGINLHAAETGKANSGRMCTPTNITYCKEGGNLWSGKFKTYTVRCSDGSRRSIVGWKDTQKWCVGGKEDVCANDQLGAAKMACQSKG